MSEIRPWGGQTPDVRCAANGSLLPYSGECGAPATAVVTYPSGFRRRVCRFHSIYEGGFGLPRAAPLVLDPRVVAVALSGLCDASWVDATWRALLAGVVAGDVGAAQTLLDLAEERGLHEPETWRAARPAAWPEVRRASDFEIVSANSVASDEARFWLSFGSINPPEYLKWWAASAYQLALAPRPWSAAWAVVARRHGGWLATRPSGPPSQSELVQA